MLDRWRGAGFLLGNHSWTHENLGALPSAEMTEQIVARRADPRCAHDGEGLALVPLSISVGRRYARRGRVNARSARGARIQGRRGDDELRRLRLERAVRALRPPGATAPRSRGSNAAIWTLRRWMPRARATLSHALYGRDIPYVLLMHVGAFDARMMPRLLALYRRMGFHFVTLRQAEADPFYANALDLALPGPTATLERAARRAAWPIPAIPSQGDVAFAPTCAAEAATAARGAPHASADHRFEFALARLAHHRAHEEERYRREERVAEVGDAQPRRDRQRREADRDRGVGDPLREARHRERRPADLGGEHLAEHHPHDRAPARVEEDDVEVGGDQRDHAIVAGQGYARRRPP